MAGLTGVTGLIKVIGLTRVAGETRTHGRFDKRSRSDTCFLWWNICLQTGVNDCGQEVVLTTVHSETISSNKQFIACDKCSNKTHT